MKIKNWPESLPDWKTVLAEMPAEGITTEILKKICRDNMPQGRKMNIWTASNLARALLARGVIESENDDKEEREPWRKVTGPAASPAPAPSSSSRVFAWPAIHAALEAEGINPRRVMWRLRGENPDDHEDESIEDAPVSTPPIQPPAMPPDSVALDDDE